MEKRNEKNVFKKRKVQNQISQIGDENGHKVTI